MAILFSFLFTSMARSAQFETKINSARTALLERGRLQLRLQDVFLSLEQKNGSIYTKKIPKEPGSCLIVRFDHGIDPDPMFSGCVLGRIFLDAEKNLCLAIWPAKSDEAKRPWRKEILLSNVDRFNMEFLCRNQAAPPPSEIIRNAKSEKQYVWESSWPKEKNEIPLMIRLTAFQKETPLSFAFFPPSSEEIATYWEKGIGLL